ncbi:DUF6478 family protein [Sulfitobacter aestuariivivens]|uniref:Uncharacterized protein n=1 Tax=Sulfitobacter aestuariivivens TaxID=2766981 RepID=A0A927HGK8_9RHOB|nr:DUF6478 family protein [Sulfitobacter aestuariivivens]MBD3665603.1 hypothetical protein [Sulfitobacter aestuariivivens]
MSKLGFQFLDNRFSAQAVLRWARAARQADKTELSVLRRQRTRARALKTHLDRLIHRADERLALPMIGATGFPKPHNADWAWRPDLWRGPLPTPGLSSVQSKSAIGDGVALFHDCDRSELTLRQLRNLREADLAPYGLRLDVFKFDGTFLSLVVDLPEAATDGLKRKHLLRMDVIVEMEHPLEIFARLNIKSGPNTEQLVRELPLDDDTIAVEFDLAYTNLNEKRVDAAWIDIIFESPEMNQVVLRDLTFSRRPRAQL